MTRMKTKKIIQTTRGATQLTTVCEKQPRVTSYLCWIRWPEVRAIAPNRISEVGDILSKWARLSQWFETAVAISLLYPGKAPQRFVRLAAAAATYFRSAHQMKPDSVNFMKSFIVEEFYGPISSKSFSEFLTKTRRWFGQFKINSIISCCIPIIQRFYRKKSDFFL